MKVWRDGWKRAKMEDCSFLLSTPLSFIFFLLIFQQAIIFSRLLSGQSDISHKKAPLIYFSFSLVSFLLVVPVLPSPQATPCPYQALPLSISFYQGMQTSNLHIATTQILSLHFTSHWYENNIHTKQNHFVLCPSFSSQDWTVV